MLQKWSKIIVSLLLPLLVLGVISCVSLYNKWGHRKIVEQSDTTADRKRIAEIRSLNNNVFDSGIFYGRSSDPLRYRILLSSFRPGDLEKLPLVIVFHGSGAIGTDNNRQLGVLVKLWADKRIHDKYPACIVAPQFASRSSNYHFDSAWGQLGSLPAPCLSQALMLIDSLKKVYPIDERRIYVVGFSMGGSSVINALSLRPDLFAAGVSISGVPQFDSIQSIANIPLLLVHGNKDTENPFSSDSVFYNALKSHHKIRFWEYDGKAHDNIFAESLLGDRIPQWLFSKRNNL